MYYWLQKFWNGVYHCLEKNYLQTILQNFFQIQNTLIHIKSNLNWYMIKELNIRIKANIATTFWPVPKFNYIFKSLKISLNLMCKGDAFQTLEHCMCRLLVPNKTWLDFGISKFSLYCSICALLVLRTLNKFLIFKLLIYFYLLFIFNLFNVDKLTYIFDIWK